MTRVRTVLLLNCGQKINASYPPARQSHHRLRLSFFGLLMVTLLVPTGIMIRVRPTPKCDVTLTYRMLSTSICLGYHTPTPQSCEDYHNHRVTFVITPHGLAAHAAHNPLGVTFPDDSLRVMSDAA